MLVILASGASELGYTSWPNVVSGLALSLFILLEWSALATAARVLVIAAILLLVWLALSGRVSQETLEAAVNRSAFLAFFILSFSFLRDAAQTSKLVHKIGLIIVNQSPGRRYITLSIGSHIFATLMNLGAVNLLATMIRRSLNSPDKKIAPDIREIRLQHMSMAVLRGFCAMPLWSPTSITVAIVLAGIESLSWFDLLPLGVSGMVFFIFAGWWVDRITFPAAQRVKSGIAPEPLLKPLLPLLAIVILIPATALAFSQLTGLRLISSLLISVPFLAIGWIFVQYHKAGTKRAVKLLTRRLWRSILPSFRDLRSEITIFSSSGFIAVLVLPQIDVTYLGNLVSSYNLSEGVILVLSSWLIILPSLIGIGPMILAWIIIEILPQLDGFNFNLPVLAFMIMFSWAISVGISPFSTPVRLTARFIDRSPQLVGTVWNRRFSILVILALDGFLLLVS